MRPKSNERREKKKMSVKIRLMRMGKKKRPFYRIVVASSEFPRDGRIIETLGTFDPCVEPEAVRLDEEKAKVWLDRGAIPTKTTRRLLKKAGLFREEPKPTTEEAAAE